MLKYKNMNLWHDVKPERIKTDKFVAVIEIKKGSKNKYEFDKETGALRLDRILYTSTHYPANYGFIPLTLAEDNDPLDVLVISSEAIDPMSLVECYPIGAVRMRDNLENDDKILAIPVNDPTLNHVKDICGLSSHIVNEIMHFFKVYKQLEGKDTDNLERLGIARAKEMITIARAEYDNRFRNKWLTVSD